MSDAAEETKTYENYEAWKARAIQYAWDCYTLPADCIEDDMYKPMYDNGGTPEECVDEHCEDCGIERTDGPWGLGSY